MEASGFRQIAPGLHALSWLATSVGPVLAAAAVFAERSAGPAALRADHLIRASMLFHGAAATLPWLGAWRGERTVRASAFGAGLGILALVAYVVGGFSIPVD